jgi:seryl-tRNA synthetase
MRAKKNAGDESLAQSSSTKILQQIGGKQSIYDQAKNYAFDAYTNFVKKHAENEKHRRELNKLHNQINQLRDANSKDVEFKITPPPTMVQITGHKNIEELRSIGNKYKHATTDLENDALQIKGKIKEAQHVIRDIKKAATNPEVNTPSVTSRK